MSELSTDDKGERVEPDDVETADEWAAGVFDDLCVDWAMRPDDLCGVPIALVTAALRANGDRRATDTFVAAARDKYHANTSPILTPAEE